jgi:hypothetical protein
MNDMLRKGTISTHGSICVLKAFVLVDEEYLCQAQQVKGHVPLLVSFS